MTDEEKSDPKAEKSEKSDKPEKTAKSEKTEKAEKQEKPAAATGPALPILLGAVVGGLALGGVLGGLVLGPRIVASRSTATASHEEGSSDGKKDEHGKKKPEKKPSIYRLENLIVNPAGSQGSRFLMATVAVEVPTDEAADRLREHDVQVRDAVTAVLESQTMEMLTRAGARDSLRRQLAAVVGPLADDASYVRVYLPQFVIQ